MKLSTKEAIKTFGVEETHPDKRRPVGPYRLPIKQQDSPRAKDKEEKEYTITVSVKKFKEILIHSWDLLSREQQEELASYGISPWRKKSVS